MRQPSRASAAASFSSMSRCAGQHTLLAAGRRSPLATRTASFFEGGAGSSSPGRLYSLMAPQWLANSRRSGLTGGVITGRQSTVDSRQSEVRNQKSEVRRRKSGSREVGNKSGVHFGVV